MAARWRAEAAAHQATADQLAAAQAQLDDVQQLIAQLQAQISQNQP